MCTFGLGKILSSVELLPIYGTTLDDKTDNNKKSLNEILFPELECLLI